MTVFKKGATVDIIYNDGTYLKGVKVLHITQGPGDMWEFQDKEGVVFAQNPISPNLDKIIYKSLNPTPAE